MQKTKELLITPETKLADLLSAFPQLEEELVQLSPAYAKLRNPLLRKTIGKVATMRQVAEIGKIPIGDLINKCRSAVGQNRVESSTTASTANEQIIEIDNSNITMSLDARPMLEQGIHPLGQVLQEVENLNADELYELITPFAPIPLIEKVEAKGFSSQSVEKSANEIRTYFKRKN